MIFQTDLRNENTVVICALTSRHHILSNMQDRLLQLIQIFQYLHRKIKLNLIITNKVVGSDIVLPSWSKLGFTSMGFDTSTLTQDSDEIGYFGLTTDCPIPMFQYGDRYTWLKYGYHILHPDLKRTYTSGLETTYRKTLSTFLQTDLLGMQSFQMELHRHSETYNYVASIFPENIVHANKAIFFDELLSVPSQKTKEMFSFFMKKADKATVLPLSLFSNLFHQRYPKHQYLESTLELLQQFYIAIKKSDDAYHIFPGDRYLTSLKCMRCHKCISLKKQGIAETLIQAPTAILRHFDFSRLTDDDSDVSPLSLPLLFSSEDSYQLSKKAFDSSMDNQDEDVVSSMFCFQNTRHGEFKFCEAAKVDVSYAKGIQTKERNHEKTVSNSLSLVWALFEEICLALTVSDSDDSPVKDPMELHHTLFNASKTSTNGYVFGMGDQLDD